MYFRKITNKYKIFIITVVSVPYFLFVLKRMVIGRIATLVDNLFTTILAIPVDINNNIPVELDPINNKLIVINRSGTIYNITLIH